MMVLHEVRGTAADVPDDGTHIIPAFGAGMCPKLVAQVSSVKRSVRVSALLALCDELKKPKRLAECLDLGIINTLNAQISSDSDAITRFRASKALGVCSLDANGCFAMIKAKTASVVSLALSDDQIGVRRNIYEALIQLSTGCTEGASALVKAKYPALLVTKATTEDTRLQALALRLLCNCLNDNAGLEAALGNSAVETCIMLLPHSDTSIRCEAARTLARLCFSEMAKMSAIDGNAVPALVALLKDPERMVRAAAVGALMAITTTDQGKISMVASEPEGRNESISLLVSLLKEGQNDMLAINTLKCIANVAVHPVAQKELQETTDCLNLLSRMCVNDDEFIAKHASIAKKVVMWRP